MQQSILQKVFLALAVTSVVSAQTANNDFNITAPILVDLTRAQPPADVFYANTMLETSSTGTAAKNLPFCASNFWKGTDDFGFSFTCSSNSSLVLAMDPLNCLEFSKVPNFLGIYECISCPWANGGPIPNLFPNADGTRFAFLVNNTMIVNPLPFSPVISPAPNVVYMLLPHTIYTKHGKFDTVSTRTCAFWPDYTIPQHCSATSMTTDGKFKCQPVRHCTQYAFDDVSVNEYTFAHCLTWRLTVDNKFQCTTSTNGFLNLPSNNDPIVQAQFNNAQSSSSPSINFNNTDQQLNFWTASINVSSDTGMPSETPYPWGINSGPVSKNIPACPNNAWFLDPMSDYSTASCVTNSSLVISSHACAEYNTSPNAFGVYECVKVPYGGGSGIQSFLYGQLPDPMWVGSPVDYYFNFTVYNAPIFPSQLDPHTSSLELLYIPFVNENNPRIGITSLISPNQFIHDLCTKISLSKSGKFVCLSTGGQEFKFNPSDSNLNAQSGSISACFYYKLIGNTLHCLITTGF